MQRRDEHPRPPRGEQSRKDAPPSGGRDPYAVSSEERMQRYKEKYGAAQAPDDRQDAARGNPEARSGSDRKSPGRRGEGDRGRGDRQSAETGRPRNPAQASDRGRPERSSAKPDAKPQAKPGILDRIKGLFRPRKDR